MWMLVFCTSGSRRLLRRSRFVEKCRCDGQVRRRGVAMAGTISVLFQIASRIWLLGLRRSRGRLTIMMMIDVVAT